MKQNWIERDRKARLEIVGIAKRLGWSIRIERHKGFFKRYIFEKAQPSGFIMGHYWICSCLSFLSMPSVESRLVGIEKIDAPWETLRCAGRDVLRVASPQYWPVNWADFYEQQMEGKDDGPNTA